MHTQGPSRPPALIHFLLLFRINFPFSSPDPQPEQTEEIKLIVFNLNFMREKLLGKLLLAFRLSPKLPPGRISIQFEEIPRGHKSYRLSLASSILPVPADELLCEFIL